MTPACRAVTLLAVAFSEGGGVGCIVRRIFELFGLGSTGCQPVRLGSLPRHLSNAVRYAKLLPASCRQLQASSLRSPENCASGLDACSRMLFGVGRLPLRAPFRVFAKKLIELIMRRGTLKPIKPSILGKIFRRPHEPAPSRAGERTAHTDPPHSECCEVRHR